MRSLLLLSALGTSLAQYFTGSVFSDKDCTTAAGFPGAKAYLAASNGCEGFVANSCVAMACKFAFLTPKQISPSTNHPDPKFFLTFARPLCFKPPAPPSPPSPQRNSVLHQGHHMRHLGGPPHPLLRPLDRGFYQYHLQWRPHCLVPSRPWHVHLQLSRLSLWLQREDSLHLKRLPNLGLHYLGLLWQCGLRL